MNNKTLAFVILLLLCSSLAKAQVVTSNNGKVEVRDEKGNYISSSTYSGLNDAVSGNGIVVLWFANGKVEVRDQKLQYISSNTYYNLKSVKTSGQNVVLQFTSGKVEVRDSKLGYISSHG